MLNAEPGLHTPQITQKSGGWGGRGGGNSFKQKGTCLCPLSVQRGPQPRGSVHPQPPGHLGVGDHGDAAPVRRGPLLRLRRQLQHVLIKFRCDVRRHILNLE